ncbi:MAG: zf-HC2 domain-containing protein [Candidatus Eisenbacteria bacterium]|uniref:Zf-HC2 domain-containing protein n=1 Tax=Eiseniibacteriota bacterium TaxID=2212470 RepID=A0A948RY59_UNCEI|nr:zf-HC2 domain-containing protein [Candidatus Eisenbacteria bacterium]MBU1950323.1 zf-HC2 domain-containing protein [Candidatus Eisenbacteria bacterium]MBU2693183.1 zf-HC2 domain-containing protein [Candidatus Eisenbacteria bacterium]
MACEKWRDLIIDRLADELGEEDAVLLEQHLADCADCTKEEQRLSRLLHAVLPREEWPEKSAIEDRLAAVLRQRTAAWAPAASAPAGSSALRRRISQGAQQFLLLFRQPMPIYAVFSLVLLAVTTGFWIGHASVPDGSAELYREPVWLSPEDLPPSEQGRGMPVAVPTAERDGNNAGLALVHWPMDSETRFSQTPTDAISLDIAFQPDSL